MTSWLDQTGLAKTFDDRYEAIKRCKYAAEIAGGTARLDEAGYRDAVGQGALVTIVATQLKIKKEAEINMPISGKKKQGVKNQRDAIVTKSPAKSRGSIGRTAAEPIMEDAEDSQSEDF